MRKCISAENSQEDLWGKLICTNFKVSFIPQDDSPKEVFLELYHTHEVEAVFVATCAYLFNTFSKQI